MKLTEYKTVEAKSHANLDHQVNILLNSGYHLYGFPYAVSLGAEYSLFQALTKTTEEGELPPLT